MFNFLITAHNEQTLLTKSVVNVFDSIDSALCKFDFAYEVRLNLDNSDDLTLKTANDLASNYTHLKVTQSEFGDVSKVRNNFASDVSSSFLFFLDGDDFWSPDWVTKFCELKRKRHDTIYHPNYTIFYDSNHIILLRSKSRQSLSTTRSRLLLENLWSSSFIAHSDIFRSHKFRSGKVHDDSKFAYEDWSFFRDCYAYGFRNSVLKNTTHFHLLRMNSNTKETIKRNKFPHPYKID